MTDTAIGGRSAPPAFPDVAAARFRAQREADEDHGKTDWQERYHDLRSRFEAAEGKIDREYWGVNLPLGLVLTEKPRHRLNVWLRRPPRMRLHRAPFSPRKLPVSVHGAAHDGDMLAVRAAWSLGDLSRHTVLARIFEVQEFLLEVVDASSDRVEGTDATEPAFAEALDHYYEQLYRVQLEFTTAARRRAQYLYSSGALLGLLGFALIALICVGATYALGHSIYERPIAAGFGCAIAGALGATTSVSWRASLGSLQLDPAAGIGALPRLGALRPSLGAIFGLAIYFALQSGIIEIGQSDQAFYFFAFFSFVAGFSERALPDLVRRAEGSVVASDSSDPVSSPDPPGSLESPD